MRIVKLGGLNSIGEHPHVHFVTAETRSAIELALQALLGSKEFRGSPKSCEFLRFVVECALNARFDLLNERALGVTLLARGKSYHTGSDAAVRVRASHVRRRLAAFYGENAPRYGWKIQLAAGSYRPQFIPVAVASQDTTKVSKPR